MFSKTKLVLLAALLASTNLFGQHIRVTDSIPKDAPRYHHSFQVELLGNSFIYSVNYEFRFTRSETGFGMRVGAGFFGVPAIGLLVLPVGINHLAGKAPHYFESGLGYTYAHVTGFYDDGIASVLIPSIGYRRQKHKTYFTRIFISPLVNLRKQGGVMFWAGFGFGYKL